MIKRKGKVLLDRSKQLQLFIACFLLGIVYGYILNFSASLLLILIGVFLAFILSWKNKQIAIIAFLSCFCFIFGVSRISMDRHIPISSTIDFYNGDFVTFEGKVIQAPDVRPDKTYLIVEAEKIYESDQAKSIEGKIRVTTRAFPEYNYGDQLKIRGILQTPQEGAEFNFRNYLAKDGIFTTMSKPNIEIIGNDQEDPFFSTMFTMRKRLEQYINRLFPEPNSSLLAGLLLGIRKTMPADLQEGLNDTGLTHIIAISGFNITIIIAFFAGFVLSRFRRSVRFIISVVMISLFVVLVGASPPVLRAAVMGIIGLMALTLGRTSDAFHTLLITLFIMVIIQPLSLILDIGFQLSFLATLGLIFMTPLLERIFQKVPSFLFLKETLITTISAQIFVLPLILLYFGRFSLLSPITNILVLPIIPVTMLFGFIALMISLIPFLFTLAKIVGFVAWLLLSYIVKIVEIFATFPFTSLEIQWWNTSLTLIAYSALAVITFIFSRKNNVKI